MSRKQIKPDPKKWLRVVDEMLTDPDFEFAEEYLSSVKEFIEVNDRITNKQTAAILKIRRSAQ